eukprot:1233347-Pyramimonas_sp.AAC.1
MEVNRVMFQGHTLKPYSTETVGLTLRIHGLPKWRQPASWAKCRNLVCRLRLALYGHPLAGVFWER